MGVKFTNEQQAVIDARDCNILVSAAAGSGKTAVLVERIIQMVLEGRDIDHFLVVTFTKAAASQMKEKITLAIQKKLVEEPDNKHLQKQETLIHNAQITTIDSFCQYVLRNNFNAIGVDPSFRVGDDGELKLLREEVIQDMLEEEYALASEAEDSDFLFCMEYFSSGSNDKKVEEYIFNLFKFAMSMPWPEDWINERSRDYQIEDAVFDELDWVKDCMNVARGKIKEMVSNLETAEKICCESDGPYKYGDVIEKDKDSIEALLRYESYDALFDGLRTISFDNLPRITKNDAVNDEKKVYVKDLRDDAKKGITKLIESYFALPAQTIVEQMKLCDRAVKELCRLTIRYKQLFDEKKRERQLIDFSDMEHLALQILVNHPSEEETIGKSCQEIIDMCTPSVVALEYRDYYKEVLIDEYQDSNNVQEMILKAISGDIPDKSERFMVGDVKQSIYKFRQARPEIFMEKLATFKKEEGSKDRRIDLHKNFRSRKEVLEATNYIFEKIMGKDLGSVEYDQDARLVTGNMDYQEPTYNVSPELIMFEAASEDEALADYDPKEKEALVIAERIHKLMKEDENLRFKDMVILLRSRAGWEEVFRKVLEEQGIPAYTESRSGYFDAFEVSTMLDLLTIIDNPSQDIPLVSVMHSAIGGFDDQELASLRVLVDKDDSAALEDSFYYGLKKLVAAGTTAEKGSEADEELLRKVAGFIDFLENLRTISVYTPVHELLQHILDETAFDTYCLAMPAGNQRKANIDQLLSMAYSFEKTSFKGLFHFVRYVEHMRLVQVDYGEAGIIDENADVVRIMSIHKSKGLEFPVVFVAGLTKQFNSMDTKGDLTLDMDLGIGVKCINTELRVKYDTLKRIIIADKMNMDNLGEELRVLYVALTRAKEKLIMTASVKKLPETVAGAIKKLPVLSGKEKLMPYSYRAEAKSYFSLVLPSLVRHPAFAKAAGVLGFSEDMFKGYIDEEGAGTAFEFFFLSDDMIVSEMIKNDTMGLARRQELEEGAISFDNDIAKRLKIKFESGYAFEPLKGLFTKTTVTELKKHKLEEMGESFAAVAPYAAEDEEPLELSFEDMNEEAPKSEKPSKVVKLTGAERGTAYHRIMEILDKDIYGDEAFMDAVAKEITSGGKVDASAKRIYAWMCDQAKKGMIPDDYLSCVYSPDIEAFLKTDLGRRMGAAFRRGDLYREKPFMMGISAADLDPKFPEEEMVLIQGIIDAWFVEDGEIVLLDYKTDRVKEESELISRYSIQLDLYKQALERTTNMKVKEVLIYSFGLSCVVPMGA